jgi:hypothetical protein
MKRKHIVANFFGIYLRIPQDLLNIVFDYCDNAYCSSCNLYYPKNFCCLYCINFKQIICELSSGCQSRGLSINFNSPQDQLIWDYSNIATTNLVARAFRRGNYCISPLTIVPYTLMIAVSRKRTRRSRDNWTCGFHPSSSRKAEIMRDIYLEGKW